MKLVEIDYNTAQILKAKFTFYKSYLKFCAAAVIMCVNVGLKVSEGEAGKELP